MSRSRGKPPRRGAEPSAVPPECVTLVDSAAGLRRGAALGEHGVRVAARSAGERICAYELDGTEGRAWLGMDSTTPISDGAFAIFGPQCHILLVELKGVDVRHGIEQLRSTASALRKRLRSEGCDGLWERVRAVVVSGGGAPSGQRDLVARFESDLDIGLQIKTGVKRAVELRDLLGLFGIRIDE